MKASRVTKSCFGVLLFVGCFWSCHPLRGPLRSLGHSHFSLGVGVQRGTLNASGRLHALRDGSRPSNEYGVRFERMLQRCREYDDELLNTIDDSRLRALVMGVVDGARTPEVTNAFRILYEDYMPLRVSGDFIFSRMDRIVLEARRRRASGMHVTRRSGSSMSLTSAQIGAEQAYRKMLEEVAAWEAALDEDKFGRIRTQRLGNVLIGCFVGARTDGVVNALKILYMDYALLRTGGNLIFSLMRGAVRPYVDQKRARFIR